MRSSIPYTQQKSRNQLQRKSSPIHTELIILSLSRAKEYENERIYKAALNLSDYDCNLFSVHRDFKRSK